MGRAAGRRGLARLGQNPEACTHFQGKDNIVFHCVIWPAMLLGYGKAALRRGLAPLEQPTTSSSTEYLTIEGKKFSRVAGTRSTRDFLDRYDPDPLRYYLVAAGPETPGHDTWASRSPQQREPLANWATSST